ncbi:TMEM165/GDT1 family protein [Marinihelvus fidelis]|uniref:GDT1 family protein n=1 Tax=Marinihelvus fidelis TaxID=2613842 RepID=A0A5N0TAG4_9GAMM|nr:TMEM165/GDT1 family protein [Marinihelvus fidelis]KAA9131414.1 TMEM165/GDT1 family protein [Marinihelvus fidelis]
MEWKLLATVFASVFIAEMADKTQLVTMLFAADRDVSRWTVFLGAAAALVLTSAIGVAAGAVLSEVINPRIMSLLAGSGFIVIGAWVLWQAIHGGA